MIIGIGIDILEIKRMEKNLASTAFMRKVFHPNEIRIGDKNPNQAQFYAGRYCGKEAFFKACTTELKKNLSLLDVVIVNDEAGKPVLRLGERLKKKFNDKGIEKIHISISHSDEYATSVVIIEGR